MRKRMYRQGDVLIEQVAKIPKEAIKQSAKDRIILALGEATGHHHSVDIDAADWWKQADGAHFLDVPKEARVTHQEHDTITLPAGRYRIRRQREYTPEAIRNVAD